MEIAREVGDLDGMLSRAMTIRIGICVVALLAALGGGATWLSARAPVSAAAPAPVVKPAEPAAPAIVPPAAAAPAPSPPAPAPEALVVKRVLQIDGPIKFGDYYWDAEGISPDGSLVITVDLEAQTMSVFRDGYEIGATAVLYGMDEKPTPLGVFPITQKKVHHISNLYGAPMPYMMRLTNDGVAIHASEIDIGLATHGCIGVPLEFAKLLYAQAKLGDRVIITRGKRLDMGGVIAPQ